MRERDTGYSLAELVVIVFIIGVLVAIAVPVYFAATTALARTVCHANQRTIEGAAVSWSTKPGNDLSALEGRVHASHPLVAARHLQRAPRCPSAPPALDRENPTIAEGGYAMDARGKVEPCAQKNHGHY